MSRKPGIHHFDYSLDFKAIDFRQHPDLYRVGRGEQGVLLVEPYKSELLRTGGSSRSLGRERSISDRMGTARVPAPVLLDAAVARMPPRPRPGGAPGSDQTQ